MTTRATAITQKTGCGDRRPADTGVGAAGVSTRVSMISVSTARQSRMPPRVRAPTYRRHPCLPLSPKAPVRPYHRPYGWDAPQEFTLYRTESVPQPTGKLRQSDERLACRPLLQKPPTEPPPAAVSPVFRRVPALFGRGSSRGRCLNCLSALESPKTGYPGPKGAQAMPWRVRQGDVRCAGYCGLPMNGVLRCPSGV